MRAVFVCGDPADSGLSQPWDQQFGPSGDRGRVLEGEREVRALLDALVVPLLCPCGGISGRIEEATSKKESAGGKIKAACTCIHSGEGTGGKALRGGTVISVSPEALLLRSKYGKLIASKNITNIGLHIDRRACEGIRFTASRASHVWLTEHRKSVV